MIPLIRPTFPDILTACVYFEESLATGQLTNFGPVFNSLTERLNKINERFNLVLNSGTTAIETALALLKMKDKRVVLPDYTHSGTYLAVLRAGAIPVLSNATEKDWTLDLETLEEHVNEFDCIIVVSPFGYKVDIKKYDEFAALFNKEIIYDFAGNWPDNGNWPKTEYPVCYSFHSTKNFGVGEGGMVSLKTHDEWLKCRRIINFGTLPDRSINGDRGFNGKIDEFKCSLIMAQIDGIQSVCQKIDRKRQLISKYKKAIPNLYNPEIDSPSLCVFNGLDAEKLEFFSIQGDVVFKQYYPLLSRMSKLSHVERFKESSDYFKNCCALPSDVTEEELIRVIKVAWQHRL